MTSLSNLQRHDGRDDVPSIVPRTPQHKSHNEIIDFVESLATKHNLSLKRRDGHFSPSSFRQSDENSCYNSIRFLFYRNRPGLDRAISSFEDHAFPGANPDELLQRLKKTLSDECWMFRERISPGSSLKARLEVAKASENPRSTAHESSANLASPFMRDNRNGNRNVVLPSSPHSTTVGPLTTLNGAHRENVPPGPSGYYVNQSAFTHTPSTKQDSPLRRKYLPNTENKPTKAGSFSAPETPSDDDWSYETAPEDPPDSPTLMAQSERQKRVALQSSAEKRGSFSNPSETWNLPAKADRKRSSEEVAVDSFKRTRSNEVLPDRSRLDRSFLSEGSTARSMLDSVWSQDQDGPATAATSFMSHAENVPEQKLFFNEPKNFHSSDNTSVDVAEMQRQADHTERKWGVSRDSVSYEAVAEQIDDEPLTQPTDDPRFEQPDAPRPNVLNAPVEKINQRSPNKGKTGQELPEHFMVRDLPKHGLFCEDVPANLAPQHFFARYEACRVVLRTGISASELLRNYDGSFDNYDTLWSHFEAVAQHQTLPKRTHPKNWDAAISHSPEVVLTGSLSFNSGSSDTLFQLRLEPIQSDRSCRFQRAFGPDKFLSVSVPSLRTLPKELWHLKGQEKALARRYHQWLTSGHILLGRTWRVLMVETKQSKKTARQPNAKTGQRLILFATDGVDIGQSSRSHNLSAESLYQAIDWFLPIDKNLDQSFCKAYSRLELGFSKTIPTVEFLPSQIRQVEDTHPDGTPESTTFNDPKLVWVVNQVSDLVMDDGCAAISLGAAQELWRILGRTDPIPSVFQARFRGAKGVWYISAPTDTTSADHRDKWIEIKGSQLKFQSHDEDLDDTTYNRQRSFFEVLKYSKPLTSSTLNLAFLPVLQDRGVPMHKICDQVAQHLDFERANLLQSLRDPRSARRWINTKYALLEDSDRDSDMAWLGGLPFSLIEKTIFLLEGGFDPEHDRYLAESTFRLIQKSTWKLMQNLSIPLGRSTNAIGISDPTGVLAPGEIHLAFSKDFHDEKSGEIISILHNKDVLVARHPTLRRSDIQKVRAVFKPELRHIRDVVVFPRTGQIPLAHKLQGGDYDGDTFWICWEPMLTQDFKNAPAPCNIPSPQSYGIGVDKTSLGNVVNTADADPVREFLGRSFDFRCQPELLGVVTIRHENLSYAENAIDSPGLNYLADMHDYLIDSSKNGYTYTFEDLKTFINNCNDIKIKHPPEPAYKTITKAKMEFRPLGRQQSPRKLAVKHNPNHITDKIVFEIVKPHIEETLQLVEAYFANSQTKDPELESFYHNYRSWAEEDASSGDGALRDELDNLTQTLTRLKDQFNAERTRKIDMDNFDQYLDHTDRFYQMYQTIVPAAPDRLHRSWRRRLLMPMAPNEPTDWDLLKASALHATCHKTCAFVFQIAGRELVDLKCAASSSGKRSMVQGMWEIMKPKKATKGETIVEGLDLQDDDEAKSEGVAESIVDDLE